VYHVNVPVEQVAVKVLLASAHIVAGLALTEVGVKQAIHTGGVTITVCGVQLAKGFVTVNVTGPVRFAKLAGVTVVFATEVV
jgi:hypothetical protein